LTDAVFAPSENSTITSTLRVAGTALSPGASVPPNAAQLNVEINRNCVDNLRAKRFVSMQDLF
jgi:hypothetical protein